jgi:peptide/nickel transport system permease protein
VTVGPAEIPVERTRPATRFGLFHRRLDWFFVLSSFWLVLIVVLALTANWLPIAPYSVLVGPPRQPPGFGSYQFFGTDEIGRSELSRLIFGIRSSLIVSLSGALIGMMIGGMIGMASGYFRGKSESVLRVFVDSVLAFPPLIFLLAVTAILTQSIGSLIIGFSIISIPAFARLSRANTLVTTKHGSVVAARGYGARSSRILFREILPPVALSVASYGFLVIAGLIVAEGSLSYLGLGIPPPDPSWGGMIAAGRPDLSTAPWLVFSPALVMLFTILSFNVVGDRARRHFDLGSRARPEGSS